MVDMVRKIHEKGAKFLRPGEQILGACTVTAAGQLKKAVALGAIGGLVGAAVGTAMKGKDEVSTPGSMAESFPAVKPAILAVSNMRWVLFEQNAISGAPKTVSAHWAHGDISGIEVEKGMLTSKVNVCFADGSVAQVEAVKSAKPEKLVEAAAQLA